MREGRRRPPRLSPYLVALTPESRRALQGLEEVEITLLPFRLGRERRGPERVRAIPALPPRGERRSPGEALANRLYLLDPGRRKRISHQHLLIHEGASGRYFLRDLGSEFGTIVEGKRIGGKGRRGSAHLHHGDTIILGGKNSPFRFLFLIKESRRRTR